METNKKHTENALKQALRRRQPGRLPSNFNYRMMEQIRLEAEKQQKRKERVMLCGMIAGILLLLGVGVYTLVFKLEFNFKEYLSGMDFSHSVLKINYSAKEENYSQKKKGFHHRVPPKTVQE